MNNDIILDSERTRGIACTTPRDALAELVAVAFGNGRSVVDPYNMERVERTAYELGLSDLVDDLAESVDYAEDCPECGGAGRISTTGRELNVEELRRLLEAVDMALALGVHEEES